MSNFAKQLIATVAASAVNEIFKSADKEIEKCEFRDCEEYTIGLKCHECSRDCCKTHIYFGLSEKLRPEAICASCVVDNHPELFEEEE